MDVVAEKILVGADGWYCLAKRLVVGKEGEGFWLLTGE